MGKKRSKYLDPEICYLEHKFETALDGLKDLGELEESDIINDLLGEFFKESWEIIKRRGHNGFSDM